MTIVRIDIFKIIFILMALFINQKAKSCDVCCCSMGGTNLGILPQFHKNFIGLHYFYRGFSSEHTILGTETKSISRELFQTTELRGRFHLNKKIQLFVLLPFNINRQTENNVTSTFAGLGDVTTFANYSIYNNEDSLSKKWKHNLQLGGGIKLPTGSYKKLDESKILNPNIQTGTGSFDILIDAIYTVRYKKWGLNNTAFYRFNTTNSNDFKYEKADKDVHNSFIVDQSGGSSLFTTFGLDFYYHSFTFGVNYQLPVYQDNLITQSKLKCGATLLYNF